MKNKTIKTFPKGPKAYPHDEKRVAQVNRIIAKHADLSPISPVSRKELRNDQ